MATATERLGYAAAQTARVAFYGAHYLVARLAARDAFGPVDAAELQFPSLRATLTALRALFRTDLANAEAGLYPIPLDFAEEIRRARASLRYLADVPKVAARRRRAGSGEAAALANGLPRYYRQNFHFQTDGYLSERSASIYDFQVEALFAGTAAAMRRRAFVPLTRFLQSRNVARSTLLDVGAGTGSFLGFVKAVHPRLKTIALDLSGPYLERARRTLREHRGVAFIEAAVEAIPLPDGKMDAVVGIYLFHELPPRVRVAAAREIARVLKPGGLFVLADTIQYGDIPDCDGLIRTFPAVLHEPYYESFARTDLRALFARAGLQIVDTDLAYLTKLVIFQKPPRSRARRKGDRR